MGQRFKFRMYQRYISSLERFTKLKSSGHKTCLSEKVHFILCKAGVELDSSVEVISKHGTLDWNVIESVLPEYKEDSYEYFVECAHKLAAVFKASHDHLMQHTPEQFNDWYGRWIEWTSIPQAVQHCFEAVKLGGNTRPFEALLLSTTILERSLGDVFLLQGEQCPSMLKDLLLTAQLKAIFGDTIIRLLRVVIGPSISLNVRNVAWHGFPSPGELSPRYTSFIIQLIISLGCFLEELQGIHPGSITHRHPIKFSHVEKLQFVGAELFSKSTVTDLFKESAFILPQMLPFWMRTLDLFYKERYDECVILLLPQIEHALRRVYAVANDCPERVLTAENNVLFTTFDEILCHKMEDGSPNKLRYYIGDCHVSMLLDLFMYPEGPRIRDRLSHGESCLLWAISQDIDPDGYQSLLNQWHSLAHHILCVAISISLLFIPDGKFMALNERFATSITGFKSVFHPVSLAQSELHETACVLYQWRDLKRPVAEDMDVGDGWDISNDINVLPNENFEKIAGAAEAILKGYGDYIKTGFIGKFVAPFSNIPALLMNCSFQLETLYRYKDNFQGENISKVNKEEEIVGLMRRIMAKIREICAQVDKVCATRYQQLIEKKLRSRQRGNYERMLKIIPYLSSGIRLVLLINLSLFHKMDVLKKWAVTQQNKDIKLLKFVLQYAENVTTYTNMEKNRWEETEKLTTQLCEKIHQSTQIAEKS